MEKKIKHAGVFVLIDLQTHNEYLIRVTGKQPWLQLTHVQDLTVFTETGDIVRPTVALREMISEAPERFSMITLRDLRNHKLKGDPDNDTGIYLPEVKLKELARRRRITANDELMQVLLVTEHDFDLSETSEVLAIIDKYLDENEYLL